mmetsp:Transcript_4690/g.18772  ORF Transcript_4690/g.18772 Transcript_4690/m.18772 type:complete len:395 (+) Transcript_4690:1905-3089(+)
MSFSFEVRPRRRALRGFFFFVAKNVAFFRLRDGHRVAVVRFKKRPRRFGSIRGSVRERRSSRREPAWALDTRVEFFPEHRPHLRRDRLQLRRGAPFAFLVAALFVASVVRAREGLLVGEDFGVAAARAPGSRDCFVRAVREDERGEELALPFVHDLDGVEHHLRGVRAVDDGHVLERDGLDFRVPEDVAVETHVVLKDVHAPLQQNLLVQRAQVLLHENLRVGELEQSPQRVFAVPERARRAGRARADKSALVFFLARRLRARAGGIFFCSRPGGVGNLRCRLAAVVRRRAGGRRAASDRRRRGRWRLRRRRPRRRVERNRRVVRRRARTVAEDGVGGGPARALGRSQMRDGCVQTAPFTARAPEVASRSLHLLVRITREGVAKCGGRLAPGRL